jgi:CubicO group peptidase (beta-lactamase class C family)
LERLGTSLALIWTAGGCVLASKSVVILHDGHIVAERYAPGHGPKTPQIGWSVTKPVTNALIGILVRQKRLVFRSRRFINSFVHGWAWPGLARPSTG